MSGGRNVECRKPVTEGKSYESSHLLQAYTEMPKIRPQDLIRVLELSKASTEAGRRIADAIGLIEQVLDDLGWVKPRLC